MELCPGKPARAAIRGERMQRPHALPQNQNEPMFRSKKESKNSGGWEGVADQADPV